MRTATLALLLAITGCLASCGRGLPPGVKSSYETVQAPVLRVYTTEEGGHRFVAYVVKWKDTEIIVSDALARSHYQPGDTISFMAHKFHLNIKNDPRGPVESLSFEIVELSR